MIFFALKYKKEIQKNLNKVLMNPERGGALYPRISKEMMRGFINQYATIVGRVQNVSGTKMTVMTSETDKSSI